MEAKIEEPSQTTLKRKHPLAKCEECPLHKEPFIVDPLDHADILLVGEAPAAQEIRDGQAFSARYDGTVNAGYILWEALRQLNIKRGDGRIAVTNTVICRTPGNRDPTSLELACCRPRLENTIASIDPKLILLMGKVAIKAILGGNPSVTSMRNQEFEVSAEGKKYVTRVTYHPAGTIYNSKIFPDMTKDLQGAVEFVNAGPPPTPKAKFAIVESVTQVRELARTLGNDLVIDIETDSDRATGDYNILCVSVYAVGDDTVYVIPDDVFYEDVSAFDELLEGRQQIYQNGMFDVEHLRANGSKMVCMETGTTYDTMFLHMCVDERTGTHGLENIANELFQAKDYKHIIKPYLPNKKTSYARIPRDVLYKYGALDVWYTGGAKTILHKKAAEEGTLRIHDEVLIPAAEPLMAMARYGIAVDQDYVNELNGNMKRQIDEMTQEIQDLYGGINPNSPQQINAKLTDMGLQRLGMSTDAESMEKLAAAYPNIDLPLRILEYRGIYKEWSTYVRPMLDYSARDGRVHAEYLPHGTVTGRLSSRNPNMQNIPRTKEMRDMFCAAPGKKLLNIDYSQHEFRVMAYYAQDPTLFELYNNGGSIHKKVATEVYGPDYTEEEYAQSKMIGFGALYGREAYSMSLQLKCSVAEAAMFLQEFFRPFPEVIKYRQRLVEEFVETGESVTALGRKRRFPLITPNNIKSLTKEVLNFPPQSTASDIVLIVLGELFRMKQLPPNKIIPVQEGHDAILFEVDEDFVDEAVRITVPHMRRRPSEILNTDLKFDVEAKVGDHWGSTKLIDIVA